MLREPVTRNPHPGDTGYLAGQTRPDQTSQVRRSSRPVRTDVLGGSVFPSQPFAVVFSCAKIGEGEVVVVTAAPNA